MIVESLIKCLSENNCTEQKSGNTNSISSYESMLSASNVVVMRNCSKKIKIKINILHNY